MANFFLLYKSPNPRIMHAAFRIGYDIYCKFIFTLLPTRIVDKGNFTRLTRQYRIVRPLRLYASSASDAFND